VIAPGTSELRPSAERARVVAEWRVLCEWERTADGPRERASAQHPRHHKSHSLQVQNRSRMPTSRFLHRETLALMRALQSRMLVVAVFSHAVTSQWACAIFNDLAPNWSSRVMTSLPSIFPGRPHPSVVASCVTFVGAR
jgi:hypothetical protein